MLFKVTLLVNVRDGTSSMEFFTDGGRGRVSMLLTLVLKH